MHAYGCQKAGFTINFHLEINKKNLKKSYFTMNQGNISLERKANWFMSDILASGFFIYEYKYIGQVGCKEV